MILDALEQAGIPKTEFMQIIGKNKEVDDMKNNNGWVKGVLPTKSGNYAVRYNRKEGRDDFTTVGNHWWNVGELKKPEEVEWKPDSFKEL